MTRQTNDTILGVILAGGQSQRMGEDKAFLHLNGLPLVEHCLKRLSHQLPSIIINSNRPEADFQFLSAPVISDSAYGGKMQQGPLGGLLASLTYGEMNGFEAVVSVAVDTPFFPKILVKHFLKQQSSAHLQPMIAASSAGLQPTFGLWPVTARKTLEAYLASDENHKLRHFASLIKASIVTFSSENGTDPFFNINHPADFQIAQTILQKGFD